MVTLIQVVPDRVDIADPNEDGTFVMLGFDENTPEAEAEIHVRVFLTTAQVLDLYQRMLPYTFTPEQAAEMSGGEA